MEYAPIIVLSLVSIFYLVALVFSVKTWRWLNIVLMLFLLPTAISFIIMFATVMKEDYSQRRAYKKAKEDHEKTTTKVREVLYGPPDATEWGGVRKLKHRLDLAIVDRGRIWKDCVPGALNEGTGEINVTTTPFNGAGGDAAPKLPHNIEEGAIFYVFLQNLIDDYDLPDVYLGEFIVSKIVDNETITLKTSLVLSLETVKEALVTGQSWSLYEIMPSDGPRAFFEAEAEVAGTQTGCEELLDDETNFEERYQERFTLLTDKYLTAEKMGMLPTDEAYISLVNSYALNWMTLEHAKQLVPTFDPPAEHQVVKFHFTKKIKPDEKGNAVNLVDLVSPAANRNDPNAPAPGVAPADSQNYDENGRAISVLLQHGGDGIIEIDKDEEIYYDAITAREGYETPNGTYIKSFKDEGYGTIEETRYRRPLNDYGRGFHQATQYRKALGLEFVSQQRHNQQIDATAADVAIENENREKIVDNLLLDQSSLKIDQAAVDKSLDSGEKKLKAAQDRLEALEKGIEEQLVMIAKAEAILVKRANDRTRAAAAESSR